jgi:CubicO group peptidase (beta-lactamase class C family)
MKKVKTILKRLGQFLVLLIILANLFIILSGRFYLYKGILYTYLHGRTGPSIYDKDIFASSLVKKSENSQKWAVKSTKNQLSGQEETWMKELKTSSFLVIKNDSIIYENYWNGHEKNTVSNSFSAAKTLVSLLIGIALDEGKIKSLDESASVYLPDFKDGGKEKITIRHLLMMSSGLDWEESGKNPLSENAESYYGTDLHGLVTRQKVINVPGKQLNYQSGNSQLLGYIIEKVTKKTVSQYAEDKIWSKINTENDGFWSLDKENGDEKAFCCFYGSTRDFAKIGKLISNKGKWNSEQIISESYMDEMLKNPILKTEEGIENLRYGLHIWTYFGGKNPAYYCRGILGQYIISIPNEKLIIVRTGEERMSNIKKSADKHKIGHPQDFFKYIEIARRFD